MAGASLKLPLGFPIPERDAVLAAARRAVDQQPEHADRRQLEAARDRALEPFLTAHERRTQADQRRRAAEARIDAMLLDAIESAVAKEEKDGLELDGPLDRVDFKFEIRDSIRGPLSDWLTPINGLNDDQLRHEIEWRARRCARELVPER